MNDAHCGEDAKTIDALREENGRYVNALARRRYEIDALREENARLRAVLERLVRALKADLIAAVAVGLPAPISPGSPSDDAVKRAESALKESR